MKTRLKYNCLWALIVLLMLVPIGAKAQKVTSITGRVTDGKTGQPLAFVEFVFAGTTIGSVSDKDGKFSLSNDEGDTVVVVRMMGYEPDTLMVPLGHSITGRMITLYPIRTELSTIQIRPDKKRKRYKRKDNPAVELLRQVLDHKDENSINAQEPWSRTVYDKSTLALDDFHPNFRKHIFWKHFPFVEKYIDTTEFDATEILNISIYETLMEQDHKGHTRTLIKAKRGEGLGQEIGDDADELGETIDGFIPPIDIYADQIELLETQFVGPLSKNLGVTFYHYYITDTIEEQGEQLVVLSFAPAQKRSNGFIGQLYIATDGTYAIRQARMRVSDKSNLNFVEDINLIELFTRDSIGRNLPLRCDTYGRFYILKRHQKLFVHQMRHFSNYQFADSVRHLEDSLFSAVKSTVEMPDAHKVRRSVWNEMRPIELRWQETVLDSFRYEMMRIPGVKRFVRTMEILGTGYVYFPPKRDSARFYLGNIYNFISYNTLEGFRFRVGGRTNARLNNQNFFNGYIAYGLMDQRPKGNFAYIHTFEEKRRHAYESPIGLMEFSAKYDIESPGLDLSIVNPDNILLQTVNTRIMQYAAEGKIRVQKQWGDLSTNSWIAIQHYEPANDLSYARYLQNGDLQYVNSFWNNEIVGSLTYTPNRKERNKQNGQNTLLSQKSRTSLSLTHTMGWMDGFYYNKSEFNMFQQLWLTPLGYIDLNVSAGKVWNQVPLPRLFIPNGSASEWMTERTFNTMRPMEYIVDQHISLFATYHMRGLILNHIPLINNFQWREVLGFNMIYGGLSKKNDPDSGVEGLYAFPTVSKRLTNQPYMEVSLGIENILKILRYDYVMRLSYKEGTQIDHGFRIGFSIAL